MVIKCRLVTFFDSNRREEDSSSIVKSTSTAESAKAYGVGAGNLIRLMLPTCEETMQYYNNDVKE